METYFQLICPDYLSATWERGIETKLIEIANGRSYFWREKLVALYRGTSRKISLSMPIDSINKEIIEMIRNKEIFQGIIRELPFKINCSSDWCDLEGNTLLHHAVTVGKQSTSEQALNFLQNILVDHRKNLLKKNREGMIPFQRALCHTENQTIREHVVPFLLHKHIEQSYAFAEVDRYQRTCLHLMAVHFHDPRQDADLKSIQIIKKILESCQGAIKLDTQDAIGLTAFDYAIIYKNYSVAQLLLEAGANPLAGICSAKLNIDEVMEAFERRKIEENRRLDFFKLYEDEEKTLDTKMITDLKSKNYSILQVSQAIAVFFQAFNSLPGETKEGRAFLCQELTKVVSLASTKEINKQDDKGYTLLHVAVLSDACEIIKMILKKGGDVNIASNNQLTPVGLSLIRGKIRSLELILKTSKIVANWPGIDMPQSTSLAFYTLSTCKNACFFEKILKIEGVKFDMLYTDTTSKTSKTLSFLDWAITLHRPIAIFILIKNGGSFIKEVPNKLQPQPIASTCLVEGSDSPGS